MRKFTWAPLALALAWFLGWSPPAPAATGDTARMVRERGVLRCGVTNQLPGFAAVDETGRWRGLSADLCRGVALALLEDGDAVDFVPLFSNTRFEALQRDDVDIVLANVTWTYARDTNLGLSFAGPYLYDGQGFLAHRSLNARKLAEVVGPASVCVVGGSTSEQTLTDLIATGTLPLTVMANRTSEGTWNSFINRECDILSSDRLVIGLQRISLTVNPDDYTLFPDTVSREPLAAVVRDNDPQWLDLVRWTLNNFALAEHLGVTEANAAQRRETGTAETRRLLGGQPGLGAFLGLDDAWTYRMIARLGNFAEIYDRNLGVGSRFKVDRGLNALWTGGGLLYPLPYR